MSDNRVERLKAASNPRKANLNDAAALSRLFASAFLNDPIIDYMVRTGAKRAAAAEALFYFLLCERDIPQGEVWMSPDGHACARWLPPGARTGPSGFSQYMRTLPMFLRVFGWGRLERAVSIIDTMEKHHPGSSLFGERPTGLTPKVAATYRLYYAKR